MRTLEWLSLLAFVPVLLVPFIPPIRRPPWASLTALLPALAMGFHLATEGWRIQMVPGYFLAAALLIARLPVLRNWTAAWPAWRGRLLSIGAILGLVLGGLLAGWLMPVVRLLQPSGPYQVGIVDRMLVDESRSRRLMVSVWYPSNQAGPPAPLTHYPGQIAAALGDLFELPSLAFQQLRYTQLAASQAAPAAAGGPFPVLVFSHGMVGLRLQNSSTLQDLASWGYIVVALDHTDAAAVTVFPDGEVRSYDLVKFGLPPGQESGRDQVTGRVFPAWVADQRFVYDTLVQWAADDPLLAGRLDLSRIGSFGHSFGGATALEVCRSDSRCRAAADLDGGLYGPLLTQPAVRPLLLMTSAESSHLSEAMANWTRLVENAEADTTWLELPNSNHLSFTISPLITPVLIPPGFEPRSGLRAIDQSLRIFFDRYLSGAVCVEGQLPYLQTGMRWRAGDLCK